MGSFFTSSQILNYEQLSKEKFIKKFCDKMKEEGYVSCDPDDGELSYVLAFRENSKWVTISSDSFEQGNEKSESDTSRIARMLETTCINTVVIDSDCAVLNLYDGKGNKADTLIMGRADDYFGDDIPAADKKVWEPLIGKEHTWDQLIAVQQGDYVFVEEGLSELAVLLNMNNQNILFEAAEAKEDESNVFLSFQNARTAITVSQNGKSVEDRPKKMTLNAAFKQVFGKSLGKMGFQVIKGRYPYLVRVINGEILHIITIRTEQAEYPEDKAFSIFGGVATVYRRKLDLGISPKDNINWLNNSIALFYSKSLYKESDRNLFSSLFQFNYFSEIPKSLITVMEEALNAANKYMIPVMDNISTLDECISFFKRFKLPFSTDVYKYDYSKCSPYNEGFLYLVTDSKLIKDELRKIINGEIEIFNCSKEQAIQIYKYFTEQELRDKTLQMLKECKESNIQLLKNQGIVF